MAALVAGGVGWALKLLVGNLHPIPLAVVVLGGYGVSYFAITSALGVSEARAVIGRLFRLIRLGN